MAAKFLPEAIQKADVTRFAFRANQLEKVDPVIAYWCNYWIVNEILTRRLHLSDEESKEYTTKLMDKLEQTRTELSGNDAITDELAAQAYVEQFALKIFERADSAVRANKATAQTADTFRAAATFLDLLTIWGPPDAEISSKAKYAKFHAMRIQKALRAGEDPNLSNPVHEPHAVPKNDFPVPENSYMQVFDGAVPPSNDESTALQSQALPASSSKPSEAYAAPNITSPIAQPPIAHQTLDLVSQNDVPAAGSTVSEDTSSISGGYFPAIPTPDYDRRPSDATEPVQERHSTGLYNAPALHQQIPHTPQQLGHTSFSNSMPQTWPESQPMQGSYRTDEDAMMNAQKHAKWAVSALNFEDVETAVKELRIALEALGAR